MSQPRVYIPALPHAKNRASSLELHCVECSLAKKKVAEKKVAITVFSFPPDKGNVGTAAYLNVFGSIYRVLQDLKAQGYTIEDVPEKEEDLIKMVSAHMNPSNGFITKLHITWSDFTNIGPNECPN